MKAFFYQAIACCAVLLPLSQLEARTYGGFKPGDKFTLKLDYRTSVREAGIVITDKQPIPTGIPNFKAGSKVEFTIGAKGQLKAKGMSMPFKEVDQIMRPGDNLYLTAPRNGNTKGDSGRLGKSASGKPVTLALDFKKTEVIAGVTTNHYVYYSFVK